MLYFIFGLILTIIEYPIGLFNWIINIIGALLLVKGCEEYRAKSSSLLFTGKLCWAYAGVAFVQIGTAIAGVTIDVMGVNALFLACEVALLVFPLIITFNLATAMMDMQNLLRKNIQAGRVKVVWIVLLIFMIMARIFSNLQFMFGNWAAEATYLADAAAIVYIVFVGIAIRNYHKLEKND